MSRQQVCQSQEIKEGELFAFDSQENRLMLTRLPEGLRALSRICVRRGLDLRKSRPERGLLTCEAHLWQFDLRDGHCTQVPGAALKRFEVKEEDGFVYVDI